MNEIKLKKIFPSDSLFLEKASASMFKKDCTILLYLYKFVTTIFLKQKHSLF